MQVGLLDLQRVEVLRGPQGTLYGRNSSGGAVRYITAMPSEETKGYLEAEAGNVSKLGVRGAVGGPISGDTFKGRVAFARESRDGYIKDLSYGGTIDDLTRTAGRVKLQYTPSEKVDLLLSADYQLYQNDGGWLGAYNAVPGPLVAAGAAPYDPLNAWAHDTPNQGYEHRTQLYSLVASFALTDDVRLKSVTSYGSHEYDAGQLDGDGTSLYLSKYNDMMWSYDTVTQEFQLTGQSGDLTWVGGLFYLSEKQKMVLDANVGPLGFAPAPLAAYIRIDTPADWDSYAAFASGSYAFNDQLAVTAGLRYTKDKMAGDKHLLTQLSIAGGPFAGAPYNEHVNSSWDDISPKLGIEYKATDDVFLYGTIAKGYKAGGFDLTAASAVPAYDPEYVWSYELGAKTEWFDKRLRANVTVFYYDYKDMQVRSLLPSPTGAGVYYQISNAGQATVKGAELELTGSPVDGLVLGANVTYLDGTYDQLIGPDLANKPVDMSGHKLVWSPPWAFNAFASSTIQVADAGALSFRVNYSWKDKMYQDPLNDEFRSYEPRGYLDASADFATADGKWTLTLYGRNLTDEVWWTSKGPVTAGPGRFDPNSFSGYLTPDRRQYGVVASYRY
jgi:iron complex outermembrane receptor protein